MVAGPRKCASRFGDEYGTGTGGWRASPRSAQRELSITGGPEQNRVGHVERVGARSPAYREGISPTRSMSLLERIPRSRPAPRPRLRRKTTGAAALVREENRRHCCKEASSDHPATLRIGAHTDRTAHPLCPLDWITCTVMSPSRRTLNPNRGTRIAQPTDEGEPRSQNPTDS